MKKDNRRRLSDLGKDGQKRLAKYIAQWPTLTSQEIADDLYLKVTAVRAVRANLTRKNEKRVNEELANQWH